MKLLIILLLTSLSAIAQGTNSPPVSTNNVTVILTADQDALLRATWRYDNNLRTNSPPIAPYTNTLPAQTFRDYMEGIVAVALVKKTQEIQGQRQNEMEVRFRNATVQKQTAVLNALK